MDIDSINKTAELSKDNSMSLMIFKMSKPGSDREKTEPYYAINIFKVKEVLNAENYPIKWTPSSNQYELGSIDIRGSYIPVYDLSGWLGFGEVESNRSVLISSEVNGKTFAFKVGNIYGDEAKNWKEIEKAQADQDKVVAQTKINDELCLIIDIERMIHEITGKDLEEEAKVDPIENDHLKKDKVILFADDQRSIRDFMASLMKNIGMNHKIFDDGEGLLKALEASPDEVGMVITDLEMPNVSGHTVIRDIKTNSKYSHIPVIVQTSMTVGDSQRQAEELGADGFIGKINPKNVVSVIEKYMSE